MRMHKHSLHLPFLAAAAALALASPPGAAEPALSLAQAQRAAVERSRSLAGQRHAVQASREMSVAAGQYPDPVLSFGLENVPAEGPDRFSLSAEPMTMRRIGVMQELTRKDKRTLRAERYEVEARRMQAEEASMTASIERDTAMAWFDAWFTDAAVATIAELRSRAVDEVAASESEYRAGRGSQPEVLMAHANVAMLDDRAAEAQRKARNARTVLARWTGAEAATRPLGPKPDTTATGVSEHEEDLARHPQIEVLDRALDAAATEAKLARANRDPDWSVQVAYQNRDSRFGDMFSVMVSVPLTWDRGNRQDREHAAKLAMAEQARAARDEALRQHAAEVRTMFEEWRSNRSRLVRYEREILPLARSRSEASVIAYRAGKADRSQVLAALRAELDARLMALMLESDTARLWAQLNFLVPENVK
jgi:outer membrane protein TolC